MFATPEVENDELLFEEMMKMLSPLLVAQLEAAGRGHHVLWQQELCLLVCRLAHFHTTRMSDFGAQDYAVLSGEMASPSASSMAVHCSWTTCYVLASRVEFLNVPAATKMTGALVAGLDKVRPDDVSAVAMAYRNSLFQSLLASVMWRSTATTRSASR